MSSKRIVKELKGLQKDRPTSSAGENPFLFSLYTLILTLRVHFQLFNPLCCCLCMHDLSCFESFVFFFSGVLVLLFNTRDVGLIQQNIT